MIEQYIRETGFFSAPLDTLYARFEAKRPTIQQMLPFSNQSKGVDPSTQYITFEFSEPLNGRSTGVDYGPLGEAYFPKIDLFDRKWSADGSAWTIKVNLEPNRDFQFLLDNNFRTVEGIPLKPLLVEFSTGPN